jgi:DNA-binding NtrC family response regulator
VLPLARHFLARHAAEGGRMLRFGEEAETALLAHSWRGNVRELENAVERAVVLCRGDTIMAEDLLLGDLEPTAPASPDGGGTLQGTLDHATTAAVRRALQATGGNRAEAARALGVDRTTLYRLLKRLGI